MAGRAFMQCLPFLISALGVYIQKFCTSGIMTTMGDPSFRFYTISLRIWVK